MNVYNKIEYWEQISGYQWGEWRGEGHDRGMGLRDTDYYV